MREKKKIVINKDNNDMYFNDVIEYTSSSNQSSIVSRKLLLDLLDGDLYEYVKAVIESNDYKLDFSYVTENGEEIQNAQINISDALHLLNELVEKDDDKYNSLLQQCSLNSLRNKYKNSLLGIDIDDVRVNYDCNILLNVFFANEEKFNNYLNSTSIEGKDTREFFYVLINFLEKERILEKYYFNRDFIKRYADLKEQKLLDFESVNFFSMKNNKREIIAINDKVKKEIIEGMDKSYSNLEKAIYAYVKLCMKFSYDYEFLVEEQKGPIADFHLDRKRLPKIENSKDLIVCYEFVYMYAKILNELGVDYYIESKGYGKHTFLNFVVDKYIVGTDAVSTVLGGDLVNAKYEFDLKGICCVNKCQKTQEEFNDILSRVYKDAIEKEVRDISTIEAIHIYKKVKERGKEYSKYPLLDRVKFLFYRVNHLDAPNSDFLGYFHRLRRVLFTKDEVEKNIRIVTLIKGTNPFMVICVNEDDYNKNTNKNEYYYYVYPECDKIKKISRLKLTNLIIKENIKYVPGSKVRVPGIGEGKYL